MSRDRPPDSPLLVLPGDRGPAASQGRDVRRHPWALPGGNGRTVVAEAVRPVAPGRARHGV